MTEVEQSAGGSDRNDGAYPRAPHWFEFNRINDLPNDWTFDVIEWDDDPEAEDVVDCGEAEVVRDDHRFVVKTWLQPRENTHDRYWSVAYETLNQVGEGELLAFHISKTQAIARNNLGHARDVLDEGDTTPHVLVRKDLDSGERETFEYPTEHMAEKAADLQIELRIGNDGRNNVVSVHSKTKWEQTLERERSLEANTDHEVER